MSVDISRFSDSLENLAHPRQAGAQGLDPKHLKDSDADSYAVVVHGELTLQLLTLTEKEGTMVCQTMMFFNSQLLLQYTTDLKLAII